MVSEAKKASFWFVIAILGGLFGCVGMCAKEPLVDIEQAGKSRIRYANITPESVPRLIEEHLVKGNVIREWAIGRLDARKIQ